MEKVYLTQLIYLQAGKESIFDQFENVAIPIISQYNGRLLLRLRPGAETVIATAIEQPYEIHLVEFDSDHDFERFIGDEQRKQFLHLKEASIRLVLLYKGKKIES